MRICFLERALTAAAELRRKHVLCLRQGPLRT